MSTQEKPPDQPVATTWDELRSSLSKDVHPPTEREVLNGMGMDENSLTSPKVGTKDLTDYEVQ